MLVVNNYYKHASDIWLTQLPSYNQYYTLLSYFTKSLNTISSKGSPIR